MKYHIVEEGDFFLIKVFGKTRHNEGILAKRALFPYLRIRGIKTILDFEGLETFEPHVLVGILQGIRKEVHLLQGDLKLCSLKPEIRNYFKVNRLDQVFQIYENEEVAAIAAENADIAPGDTVAIWGCGPVGQFAIRSAWMFGAGRVIAIDRIPERLAMAEVGKAETINYEQVDVYDALQAMTKGRGPDRCIPAPRSCIPHPRSEPGCGQPPLSGRGQSVQRVRLSGSHREVRRGSENLHRFRAGKQALPLLHLLLDRVQLLRSGRCRLRPRLLPEGSRACP